MKCSLCEKQATFNSPDNFCDEHWANWWVDGLSPQNNEERQELLKEVYEAIKNN